MKLKLSDIPPKIITITIGGIAIGLVVVLIIGLWPKPEVPPSVATTNPGDGTEDVLLGILPITITFQQDLSTDQQEVISFSAQPSIDSTTKWAAANEIQLTPTQLLEGSTTYAISVLYKNESIHTFSFQTVDISSEQLLEDIRQQAEGDVIFAEDQKEWYQNNPWYAELPIVTNGYTIVYDVEEKSFMIRLTLKEDATSTEVSAVKREALDDLEDIGANPNTQGYYFIE